MYAVIENGGKQYRVTVGDKLRLEKMEIEPGAELALDRVLMVGVGDDVQVGRPLVEGATTPARMAPRTIWMPPAMTTASRKAEKLGKVCMARSTVATMAGVGPLTASCERLNKGTSRPPITPAISPAISGVPDAKATPRQSGIATRATTTAAGTSARRFLNGERLTLFSIWYPQANCSN